MPRRRVARVQFVVDGDGDGDIVGPLGIPQVDRPWLTKLGIGVAESAQARVAPFRVLARSTLAVGVVARWSRPRKADPTG